MSSINSNTGALTALQMLGATIQQKDDVQDDVSTGKEVKTAQDNATLWAISQLMETDVISFDAVSDSLSLGEATLSVASFGAEKVTEILIEMKELAVAASSGLLDYDTIEAHMAQKTEQVNTIISSSHFNGVNLLKTDIDGTGSGALTVASSVDRQGPGTSNLSYITVNSLDFEGSASFDINNRTTITDQASAQVALGEIEGFLQYAIEGAASLGASASQMSDQFDMVGKHSDALKLGISTLTDTNMEEAATRLAALDVQQRLGLQSLSIANSAPLRLLDLT